MIVLVEVVVIELTLLENYVIVLVEVVVIELTFLENYTQHALTHPSDILGCDVYWMHARICVYTGVCLHSIGLEVLLPW